MTFAQPDSDAPFFVVINAASGQHEAQDTIDRIGALLDAAGRRHEILRVAEPTQLAEVADEAVRLAKAQRGIVVAAGGDGTLNAVARAVHGQGVVFAVLPQGTFNYFGRTHGISQELEAATRALLQARAAPVQVGRVNGRLFLVNASLGLYPQLLEDREAAKQQLGRSRWVAFFSGLRTLAGHPRQLTLDIEQAGQVRRVRTPTLFVGNNRLQLDRLGIAEAAALDAGQLDAIVVRPMSSLAMLGLALRGALGQLGHTDNVESFAFLKMVVAPRGSRRIKVALDGEIVWMRAPLVFDIPEPLMLMLPRQEDRVAVE